MVKNIYTILITLFFIAPNLFAQVSIETSFPILDGGDDAEEYISAGIVNLTSSDLEMTRENAVQVIGLRFANISIPQGATINSAYIQFTVDETDDEFTSLIIKAEESVNSAAFSSSTFNISSRLTFSDSIAWDSIPAWDQGGDAGENQRTPDLSTLISQIINQDGWESNNAMTFIISGEGKRVAISANNNANAPARLVINYDLVEFPITSFPISTNDIWRYNDTVVGIDSSWTTLDFDDTEWRFGQAQLGYGDGDESTVLDFGDDPDNKRITYYFRKKFTVEDPSSLDAINLGLLRDDGAIVYINGEEVLRSNMPEGDIDEQTFASSVIAGSDESIFNTVELENLLVAGENIIAVEVHQVDLVSSDISFDLSLSGQTISPPAIQLIHNSPDPSLALVDVYVDAFKLGNFVKLNGTTPVPFNTGTPYLSDLPAGTHAIAISPFGQEDFLWSATDFTLEDDKRYIAMVSGVRDTTQFETTFNSGASIAFKVQVDEVPGTEGIGAGESLPLFFHGTPDLPNIRLIAVGAGDATGDLEEGLPYGFQLLGGAVDALPYPIVQVTNNDITEVYSEHKIDLVPYTGQVVTIYTSGFYTAEGDEGIDASNFRFMLMPATGGFALPLPQPDPPQDGKIQIIHNSPDAELSGVDVWLNGQKAVENLQFREATAFVDISAGNNRVAIAPHSTTEADTAWSATNIFVEADLDLTTFQTIGRDYIAIAYGVRNTAAFMNDANADVSFGVAVAEGRTVAVNDTTTDIRLFHGATDIGGIDAILDGQFIPIVNDLAYGTLSPIYVSLPSNEMYNINLTDQADNSNVLNTYEANFDTLGGQALIVLASGLLNPTQDQPMFGLYAVGAEGGPATSLTPKALSVEDLEQLGVQLYPNPVKDVLTIKATEALPTLRVLDLSGRTLEINREQSNQVNWDMSDFNSGVYILEFNFKSGPVSTVIIKQ
ncbi:MAG: DUF4397 domain-containing protein [Bacteroidota bacterium]